MRGNDSILICVNKASKLDSNIEQEYQSFPVWSLCIGRMDVGAGGTGFIA